jgi:hypothetical protein
MTDTRPQPTEPGPGDWLDFTPPADDAAAIAAIDAIIRRQRIRRLHDRPTPWTFGEWLEWAEAVAVDKLARGEAFSIGTMASQPDRARVLVSVDRPDPRRTFRREIGARAADHIEEPGS